MPLADGSWTILNTSAGKLQPVPILFDTGAVELLSGTSAIYARIRSQLKKNGVVLPDPDFWIAAHALQQSLPLASTDRDFERIPGLRLLYLPPVR